MTDGSTVDVGTLEDTADKLYAIGVPQEMTAEECDRILETFEYQFHEARVIVVTVPIEGSVEISEIDMDDLFDAVDGEVSFDG